MVTIKLLDHVPHCYNSEDGQVVRDVLLRQLATDDRVTVSFEGVNSVPSSFINTALISLLGIMSFDDIRRRLKFVNTTSQINEMIKRRFVFETSHRP